HHHPSLHSFPTRRSSDLCFVNGERLFLKGTNQGPTRQALAEATGDEIAADVRLARETGLDLLRVHAHVSRPELYDAADAAGVLRSEEHTSELQSQSNLVC